MFKKYGWYFSVYSRQSSADGDPFGYLLELLTVDCRPWMMYSRLSTVEGFLIEH